MRLGLRAAPGAPESVTPEPLGGTVRSAVALLCLAADEIEELSLKIRTQGRFQLGPNHVNPCFQIGLGAQ